MPASAPAAGRRLRRHQLRARVRHAALTRAPLWLSRGRLARLRPERPLCLTRRSIVLPDLPDALDGLRIAHLSDLHIGHLTTPAHLPHIIDACQRLEAEMIAVTGDFVDLELDVLDEVIAALGRLSAPLGVYMVPGNHDYLADGAELIRRFRGAGLRLMLNEAAEVQHHGARIAVAGIDFAPRRPALARLVHRTLCRARNGQAPSAPPDLRLLLSHHPDAFEPACRHGVDLTLSGHTHGGQFILAETRGKRGSIGLGALTFRYPRGLYRRGNSYLYVNSGVGSWFPLRVKCPAEVACLTLRSGPTDVGEASHP